MKDSTLNRRQFTQRLGAVLGGAAALPGVSKAWGEKTESRHAPQHAAKDLADAIQLDSNENPYGPSERARAAITASEPIASRYPDMPDGRLVKALAQHHKVNEDQIVLGCGSTEILSCADRVFLSSGKNAVVSNPTFEWISTIATLMRANPVLVPQTADHRHDLKAMAAAINGNTGLVYICNPNNPTGTIVTLDEMRAFMRRVPPNVAVLVDEAYFHFVEDPHYGSVVDWIPQHPNLIVARTFSKVYGMAGMRLGYAVGSAQKIALMSAQALKFPASVAVVQAAIASLADPDHVVDQRQRNSSTRQWLYDELTRDRRTYIPSHANFVMIDVHTDVAPVVAGFHDRKILVGRKFPTMANWLRVSIGTPEEMQAFMKGLRDIVPTGTASTL